MCIKVGDEIEIEGPNGEYFNGRVYRCDDGLEGHIYIEETAGEETSKFRLNGWDATLISINGIEA